MDRVRRRGLPDALSSKAFGKVDGLWARLPFGERVLGSSPVLPSSPGHPPTHEDRAFSDWKAAASAPTSAILWIALEIGPARQRDSARAGGTPGRSEER